VKDLQRSRIDFFTFKSIFLDFLLCYFRKGLVAWVGLAKVQGPT
jgi:hypothetical protein